MTSKELIKILKRFPTSSNIVVNDIDNDITTVIDTVNASAASDGS